MTQESLNFLAPPTGSDVKAEKTRLSGQCARIIERLRQGPATNRELAEISLKYTSRVSDARQAGYKIKVVSRDHVTGITVYQLEK